MSKAAIIRSKNPEYIQKQYNAQSTMLKVYSIDILTNERRDFISINEAIRELKLNKREAKNNLNLNNSTPCNSRYNLFYLDKQVSINPSIKQKFSKPIQIKDIDTNIITQYPSVGTGARAIGERQSSISTYLSKVRLQPFKGRYIIKFI